MRNLIFLVLVAFVCAAQAESKKKSVVYRKTQSVDFENTDINGKVNSPAVPLLALSSSKDEDRPTPARSAR